MARLFGDALTPDRFEALADILQALPDHLDRKPAKAGTRGTKHDR
jgi:hypothetical protein